MIDALGLDLAAAQPLLAWLLTYLLHSTLLLGSTWVVLRFVPSLRTPEAEDALWKLALVGGVLTATLQSATGLGVGIHSLADTPADVRQATTVQQSVATDVQRKTIRTAPAAPNETATSSSTRAPKASSRTTVDPTRSPQPTSSASAGVPVATQNAADPARLLPWLAVGAVLVWLIGALVMLTRRFGARHRFLQRIAPRRPANDLDLRTMADDVARAAGVSDDLRRNLHLTVSETLTSPVALGRAEICLPARALDALDPAALRSMLAHEWAHLVRRDPQWRVGLTLLESIFWIQPLNRFGHRRQQDAAERRCDAWAVTCTGNARALATSLLEVADWMRTGPRPAMVSGMAGAHSSLRSRVESLLDASPAPSPSWSRTTRIVVGGLVLVLVACSGPNVEAPSSPDPPAAPPIPSVSSLPDVPDVPSVPSMPAMPSVPSMPDMPSLPDAPEVPSLSSLTTARDSGTVRAKWSNDGQSVEVRMTGSVTLTGRLDGIASMAPGSVFVLREEEDGTARQVTVTSANDGTRSYAYTQDDRERTLDADARRWMEETLQEAARRLGIGAEERVAYLLDRGGVDAVLDETEQIDSDAGRRHYYRALLRHDDLSMADRNRVLRQAQEGIDSDHEMRRLLEAVADAYVSAPEHFGVVADAVATLESDHERRRVLTHLLAQGPLPAQQQERVLDLIADMDSDHEKRRILEAIADRMAVTERGFDVLVQILDDIDSDHEKRRILVGLLQKDGYSADQQAELLEKATQLDSDHEKRRIVEALSDRLASSDATFAQLLRITRSLDSDHETRRILTTLLRRERGAPDRLVTLLAEVQKLDSDHQKARVLTTVSDLAAHDSAEVREAYAAAVRSIDSDHQRERVQRLLPER